MSEHGNADPELDSPTLSLQECATPVALTERESVAWEALTRVIMRLPSLIDADLQRSCGITFFEYLFLRALARTPQRRLRMTDLSQKTYGSLSRLSHVAQRLQKQGLITRSPDPQDRRTTVATLTVQGKHRVALAEPHQHELSKRLVLDALTPSQHDDLAHLAELMAHSIEQNATTSHKTAG